MVLTFSAVHDFSHGSIPIITTSIITAGNTSARSVSRFAATHQQPFFTPPSSPELQDDEVVDHSKVYTKSAFSNAATVTPLTPHTTPLQLQLPICLDLDTPHSLPHAGALKLASGPGILAALGGNRVLQLSAGSVWERMPYAAAATQIEAQAEAEYANGHAEASGSGSGLPSGSGSGSGSSLVNGRSSGHGQGQANRRAIMTETAREEEDVEEVLGIPRKSRTRPAASSIFVHPPTPERGEVSNSPLPSPPLSSPPMDSSPNSTLRLHSLPSLSAQNTSIPPLHVLPEVRSPPRKTIAMAADSLQLTTRRGRRPRLFGFTEMADHSSGSSAASSVAGSRSNSPERKVAIEHHVSPLALDSIHQVAPLAGNGNGPSSRTNGGTSSPGLTLPRRGPQRTQSESHLPSIASRSATNSGPIKPHVAPHAPAPNHHRNRRDNGLKLDFTGIVPVETPTDNTPGSAYISPYAAKLIRKKSGEILKPALKYGGPLTASGTPLDEAGPVSAGPRSASPRLESKSLPATPSFPKYVHFDAQLERVKLFNKDHKPRVVSRDGSPTGYTTSASEGEEYPFPSTDEEGLSGPQRKVLQIKLPNFPTSHPPDSELHLESLFLEDDRKSLKGVVMCRNIAFAKWVAVRFTFDWWQTTSEVSAVYKDNVKGGKYDRFTFQIKLADIMSKIEEKTLFICVRFNTDGREIWDSNGGGNYQVLFEKAAPPPTSARGARYTPTIQAGMGKAVGGRKSQWALSGNEGDRMADLREKLNRLTADDPDAAVQLSPNRAGTFNWGNAVGKRGGGGSPTGSPRKGTDDLPPAGGHLAARYDFGAALKGARRSSNSPNMRSVDLPNVRTGLLQFGNGTVAKDGSWNGIPVAPAWSGYSDVVSGNGTHSPGNMSSATRTSGNANANGNGNHVGFFESPIPIPATTVHNPLNVPDVQVQGPSPSPPTSPIAAKRPGLPRSQTSPAVLPAPLRAVSPALSSPTTPKAGGSQLSHFGTNGVNGHGVGVNGHNRGHVDDSPASVNSTSSSVSVPSPPGLLPSGSSTETLPDTSSIPTSPADMALGLNTGVPSSPSYPSSPTGNGGRPTLAHLGMVGKMVSQDERRDSVSSVSDTWSPTLSSEDSDLSRASYSSFIEQFCWGGGAAPSYFNPHGAAPPNHGSSGGNGTGNTHELGVPEPPRRVHSTSSLDQYFRPTEPSPSASPSSPNPTFTPGHHHSYSFSHSPSFVSQMHGHPRGPNAHAYSHVHAHGPNQSSPLQTSTLASASTGASGSGVSTPRGNRAQTPSASNTPSSGGTSWYSAYSSTGYAFGRDRDVAASASGTTSGAASPSPSGPGMGVGSGSGSRWDREREGDELGGLEHALRRSFEPHGTHGHGHGMYGVGVGNGGAMSGMPGNMSPPVRAGV